MNRSLSLNHSLYTVHNIDNNNKMIPSSPSSSQNNFRYSSSDNLQRTNSFHSTLPSFSASNNQILTNATNSLIKSLNQSFNNVNNNNNNSNNSNMKHFMNSNSNSSSIDHNNNNNESDSINYICILPNEVFEVVMKNFTSKETCKYISTLSKHFNQVSKSNSLWHHYCLKDFYIHNDLHKLFIMQIDWHKEYIIMFKSLETIIQSPLYISDESSLKYVHSKKITINNMDIQYDEHCLSSSTNRIQNPNQSILSHIQNPIILNIRKTKPDSTLFVQSKNKVAPLPFGTFSLAYFEITLLASGVDQNIFIGYSSSCETNDKKQVLRSSVSFHGGDGGMYINPVVAREISEVWDCNDTIGCGVDFVTKKIFFTKNGILLGQTTSSLSITKLYSTIGTISYGDKFSINFGGRKFEFDILQYQQEQLQQQSPILYKAIPRYPLYSIQLQTQEKYMVEYFEDEYKFYYDEEMNKITSPVNKEIQYLLDFEHYPNNDRIMKNKIHKYCHQIGQQINGGLPIPTEDQNNITELRNGLAFYWLATKQHYLLLYFVKTSVQTNELDLKYSPAQDIVYNSNNNNNELDINYLEELAKRRMAKDIGVLLSSNLDINHPFVASVIRHATQTVQKFEQNITTEQRTIYQEFEQMLQAAEQTDQRMFLALSLSIITQTKEIIKNNLNKKEQRYNFKQKLNEMRNKELELLKKIGVNIESLLEFNSEMESFGLPALESTEPPPLFAKHSIISLYPTYSKELQQQLQQPSTPSLLFNVEVSEDQRIYQKYHLIQRQRESLKLEIQTLSNDREGFSNNVIDIIVWTYLRLSLGIKNNQDMVISKKYVLETLQAESQRIEKECIKLEKEIIRLERKQIQRQPSTSSFSETFFPTSSNLDYTNNNINNNTSLSSPVVLVGGQPSTVVKHQSSSSPNTRSVGTTPTGVFHSTPATYSPINEFDTETITNNNSNNFDEEISTDIHAIQMNDLSGNNTIEDVLSPLNPKKRSKVRRPLIISAFVLLSFLILLAIILLALFIQRK